MGRKTIPKIVGSQATQIAERIESLDNPERLVVNFERFKLDPICLRGKFNNHFKDSQHFCDVTAAFLGLVLPKITSHTFKEICEGSLEGRMLHFHTVDEGHRQLVREILEEYHFSGNKLDQMLEGNNIFEFSATLGHIHAARIVCHKYENVLNLLFFDTNHHIYINEKYVKESLFYEDCPVYLRSECTFMPGECFAVSYLDENQIKESFGYSYP